MKVRVLRQFGYAADGIHIVQLAAGQDADVHDDLVPGLQGEGFVTSVVAKAPAAPVGVAAAEVSPAGEVPVVKTPAKRGRRKRS